MKKQTLKTYVPLLLIFLSQTAFSAKDNNSQTATPSRIVSSFAQAKSAVVQITNQDITFGSGFFIGPSTLVTTLHGVITPDHKITDVENLTIESQNPSQSIKVLKYKSLSYLGDLALLEVTGYEGPYFSLGQDITKGQEVTVQGWNAHKEYRKRMKGLIFNYSQNTHKVVLPITYNYEGFSGAPVFNSKFEVLGITTSWDPDFYLFATPGKHLNALVEQARDIPVSDMQNKALQNLMSLARNGNLYAQKELYNHYSNGALLPQNNSKALFWAKRAAQHNYPPALAFLSNPDHWKGEKNKPSLSEMEEWTNKAAALGESHAQYIAAQNKESKNDFEGAFQSYLLSAQEFSPHALYKAGKMYRQIGDREQALFFLRVAGFNFKHPFALFELAQMSFPDKANPPSYSFRLAREAFIGLGKQNDKTAGLYGFNIEEQQGKVMNWLVQKAQEYDEAKYELAILGKKIELYEANENPEVSEMYGEIANVFMQRALDNRYKKAQHFIRTTKRVLHSSPNFCSLLFKN